MLRLLTLNTDVRELLETGKMDMGHARALLALEGKHQSQAALQVVHKGLSVRETEHLVRRLLAGPAAGRQSAGNRMDPDTRALAQRLSEKLGAKVRFQHSAKGKGRLLIEYNTLEELDGILAHIR
jgi:ParB family chromosome partitioning protein